LRRRLARTLGLLLALRLGIPSAVRAEAAPPSFPFVIPWDDVATGTAVDVSGLDPGEAGVNGRIVAR